MRNYLLTTALILLVSCAASAQKVAGVWRLDEIKTTGTNGQTLKITQPNLYFFTKAHYSIIRVDSDKPRSTDDPRKMTAEQLLDTYVGSFIANAGTYDMKGSTLTMHVAIAKSPTFMSTGNWISYSVKMTGNTMTLTDVAGPTGPDPTPSTLTLTRVE